MMTPLRHTLDNISKILPQNGASVLRDNLLIREQNALTAVALQDLATPVSVPKAVA
jgi:hypothetical protein